MSQFISYSSQFQKKDKIVTNNFAKINITLVILYMNTNNGFTKFEDGTVIESVANRFVTFPNHTEHTGTTTSDSDYRLVINFNYA